MTKKLEDLEQLPAGDLLALLTVVADRARDSGQSEVIRAFLDNVRVQIETIANQVEGNSDEAVAKRTVANEIARLLDAVLAAGVTIGKTIEPHQRQIQSAFAGADLSKVGDSLALIASYLQNPDENTKRQAQALIGDLEKTLGPFVGYDPERETLERQERIRSEVKASMQKVFANRPLPKIEFKPKTPLPGSKKPDDET